MAGGSFQIAKRLCRSGLILKHLYVYQKLMRAYCFLKLRKSRTTDQRLICSLDELCCIHRQRQGESLSSKISQITMLLKNLGLTINEKKSQLEPSQVVEFLGMTINSLSFELSRPDQKIATICQAAKKMRKRRKVTLREVASFIGQVNSVSMAASIAVLFLRPLQMWLGSFPLKNASDYKTLGHAYSERWHPRSRLGRRVAREPILHEDESLTVTSDASNMGWGAICAYGSTSGKWKPSELEWHINERELAACILGLRCFADKLRHCTIRVQLDNTTAVWYINKKGGTRSARLNKLTRLLWLWALKRHLKLLASYKPGVQNVEADLLSRRSNDSSDYSLDGKTTMLLFAKWGVPKIDLFASRWNNKCQKYFSFFPDPGAAGVDAFAQDWSETYGYAFPPFNLVGKTIRKALKEKARLILVCPMWKNQSWWPLVMEHGKEITPLISDRNLLTDSSGSPHPCLKSPSFHLIACII
ncbi:hypothetical protein COOONC_16085 [Cooperia oncophora]